MEFRLTVVVVSMTLLLGCSGDLPTVPTTGHLGQLTFRGGVDVAESFPVQIGFTLDIRNTADRELEILSDGCGVLPRAYGTREREGSPLWDTRPNGISGEPCTASPAPSMVIPAGGSRRLTRSYGARDVLDDSLPDGRYHFSVTYYASPVNSEEVRLIEVTAGEARLELPR